MVVTKQRYLFRGHHNWSDCSQSLRISYNGHSWHGHRSEAYGHTFYVEMFRRPLFGRPLALRSRSVWPQVDGFQVSIFSVTRCSRCDVGEWLANVVDDAFGEDDHDELPFQLISSSLNLSNTYVRDQKWSAIQQNLESVLILKKLCRPQSIGLCFDLIQSEHLSNL